jgi:putative PIN family toxin of toxin-antitoxin system
MLHAVFDTNVLLSALIKRGKPRKLWDAVLDRKVSLEISTDILAEFNEVIQRPEFDRYVNNRRRARFRRMLLQKAKVSQATDRLPQLTDDPDDNMVIEAAHSSRTKYIVTGDDDLLRLRKFKRIRIISVDQALRILNK